MKNLEFHTHTPKEELKFENLDLDKLISKTKMQFLKDLMFCKDKDRPLLPINFDLLKKMTYEEFDQFASTNKFIDSYFAKINIEDKIEEAYKNIIKFYNNGEYPLITIEKKYIYDLFNGLEISDQQRTYDNQKLIVGTIGREPFKKNERIVCRINNISPEDILPRSTGVQAKLFSFNGVIIFNRNIKPEDIEIISAPEGIIPENITLPINVGLLSKLDYYKNAA